MGQISKFAVLAGVGALLAASSPVLARSGGGHAFRGHAHYAHGYVRNVGRLAGLPGGYDGYGGDYAATPEAQYTGGAPDYPPPFYPVGFGAGSYEPTGYGVVYNIPPNPPLHVRQGPHIITLSARHCRRHAAWRHRPVVIVRGHSVAAAY